MVFSERQHKGCKSPGRWSCVLSFCGPTSERRGFVTTDVLEGIRDPTYDGESDQLFLCPTVPGGPKRQHPDHGRDGGRSPSCL